jgi:YesN/AraC family two-component response regulator
MQMHSVLVIDDDLGTREGFDRILHLAGFDVATAETGSQGLTMARTRSFSVILADLRLPDMSGIDVLRSLRAVRDQVPLVIVTAFGSVKSAATAFKLGALDYVEKPLIGEDLVELVQSAAHAFASRPAADNAPEASQAAKESPISGDARVRAALQAIERRHSECDLSVGDIAREVGLSTGHFCVLLKRETACTFCVHLHQRRVVEAKKRLQETTLAIKEIAFRVGYSSTRQLDRHFLRFSGLAPMEFRRRFWQHAVAGKNTKEHRHSPDRLSRMSRKN